MFTFLPRLKIAAYLNPRNQSSRLFLKIFKFSSVVQITTFITYIRLLEHLQSLDFITPIVILDSNIKHLLSSWVKFPLYEKTTVRTGPRSASWFLKSLSLKHLCSLDGRALDWCAVGPRFDSRSGRIFFTLMSLKYEMRIIEKSKNSYNNYNNLIIPWSMANGHRQ